MHRFSYWSPANSLKLYFKESVGHWQWWAGFPSSCTFTWLSGVEKQLCASILQTFNRYYWLPPGCLSHVSEDIYAKFILFSTFPQHAIVPLLRLWVREGGTSMFSGFISPSIASLLHLEFESVHWTGHDACTVTVAGHFCKSENLLQLISGLKGFHQHTEQEIQGFIYFWGVLTNMWWVFRAIRCLWTISSCSI